MNTNFFKHLFVRSLCIICLSIPVSAFAQLTANFSADNVAGCAPMIVHFTNTSTGATSYTWDFGNTNTSLFTNASTSYGSPGTYTVTLTAKNGNNTSVKTMTITVYGPPQVKFTSPTSICAGSSVSFTDQTVLGVPGAGTYSWNFGDGGTSPSQNPTHPYATPGTYTVSLLVTNSQGCDSLLIKTAYIHVLPPPAAAFTANDTHFCSAPATAAFTNQTAGNGAFTYAWTFGDGGTSTSQNPTHPYQTRGSYTVSLTVTDVNGCTNTITENAYITVGGPAASFTASAGCAGARISFANTSTPVRASASWDFGDGSTAAGTTAAHTYSAPGTYNVKLVVNDGVCKDSITLPVVVNPNPVINFTYSPTQLCSIPVTVQFTSTAPAGSTYLWSFSNGGSYFTANATRTYNSYTTDTATLTVTNSNGCQSTVTKPISIYDLHAVASTLTNIGYEPYGCTPLTTEFGVYDSTNTPLPGIYPYPIVSQVWNFGDNTPPVSTPLPMHTYVNPGHYTAYVTVTTANGCTATDSVHIVTAPPPPLILTATPTHICNDQVVFFHANSVDSAVYTWYYGDGTPLASVMGDSVESHRYSMPGFDTAHVVITLDGCNDTSTFSIIITIDSPKAQFVPHYFCDTLTKVSFSNSSLGSNNVYAWSFGDGDTSTLVSPIHKYAALGTYNAQLISYNAASGCRDTFITPVRLHTLQPAFTANDTAVCLGVPITLTSTVTGGTPSYYFWYADSVTLIGINQSSTKDSFSVKGRHSITLVITDDHSCRDTLVKPNYILVASPVDSFSFVPNQGCVPLTVQFTDHSYDVPGAYIVSRSWFFDDGTASLNGGTNVSHTYTTVGGYYEPEETIIDNLGCTDTLVSPNYIGVYKPHAGFTASTLFPCRNHPMSFTDNSINDVTDAWTFGDNTTSSTASPDHTYTANGIYQVRLIVTDAHGCMDTATTSTSLTVAGPTAGFNLSDSVSICSPLIENFTNTSVNAASYNWDFGNTGSSLLTNPSTPYAHPGSYVVTLVAKDVHGCTDTAYRSLHIYGYAGEFTYTPLVGCNPLTVNFVANISNVPHITWDFSDGNVSNTSSSVTATHTYTSPGSYVPRLIISDSTGCSASSLGTDTIKVDGIVGGYTTAPYPVCIYDTVRFVDTSRSYFSAIVNHKWTFDTTIVSYLTSPSYYFKNGNDLIVNLIVTNGNGCKDTVNGTVIVHPLPVISTSLDTIICLHDSATVTAYGGVSYVWSPAATVGCPTCVSTHVSPHANMVYTVKGTDGYGCVNTDSLSVYLKVKTTAWPGSGGAICNGQSISLDDSGAQNYSWYPTAGLSSSTIANPIASPSYSINYMVVATQGSCTPDTNYVNVIVHQRPTVKATAGSTRIIAGSTADLLASGTDIMSFYWEPATLIDCDSCSRVVAKLYETTTFTVTGITEYGCKDSDKVTVEVICDKSQVFIPNSFTPNGDGQNDVFYPRGVGLKLINSFRIYNRWGEMVFERKGIQLNDESNAWDGTVGGGKPLPDVYVYDLEGVCDNGSPINWKGDVTIIR